MLFDHKGHVPQDRFIQPRVEAEIALCSNPDWGRQTAKDVIEATDYVPSLEILDTRILGHDTQRMHSVLDTISDNAANAGIVLGPEKHKVSFHDLRWTGAIVFRNGEAEERPWRRCTERSCQKCAMAGTTDGSIRTKMNPVKSFSPAASSASECLRKSYIGLISEPSVKLKFKPNIILSNGPGKPAECKPFGLWITHRLLDDIKDYGGNDPGPTRSAVCSAAN